MLDEKGVSVGDVVAIMLPNRVEFVVAMFAAWRLGAAVTPISPTLVPAEAAYQIEDAAAKVVIVDMPVEIDAQVVDAFDERPDRRAGPGALEPAEHSDDALALLIYTSGTTGRPKGVMLDHANLNAMCRMVIDAFKMTSDDHSLLILPLFHVNGIVAGTLSPLVAGGRTTIAGRFSPKTFFDQSSNAARPTSPRFRPSTPCSLTCPPRCARTHRRSDSPSAAPHRQASSC